MKDITITIGKHETTITRKEAKKLLWELKSKLAEPVERIVDTTVHKHVLLGCKMSGEPGEVPIK